MERIHGGSINCKRGDRVVMSFSDMKSILDFALGAGCFAGCAGLALQCRYPAMGNPLSEILRALVASHYEYLLEFRKEEPIAARLTPAHAQKVSD